MSYVTLNEAASFLGVSKSTLRNWDKSGKLRAVRHPINDYRVYALTDLQAIQAQLPFGADIVPVNDSIRPMDTRSTRAFVSRLHNILRDNDSHSNIIERFDELTKLLFLKLVAESAGSQDLFTRNPGEGDEDYARRIRAAYADAARTNSSVIPSTFATLAANDSAVCECATAMAQVTFRNAALDVKGLAYEEVIKNTFDKNDNQQFFTPPPIVKFMVEMMAGNLKGAVCDPASGTAGFLIEVLKSGSNPSSLTALEIDERLAWVSGMNLFAHGAKKAAAHWLPSGGTLGTGAERFFGGFDAIITNPPFGSDFTDTTLLESYSLGKGRTSRRRGILFLERCHQLLRDKGMLAFIIDEGVLNLPSSEDVRHFISERFQIHAVVSLPDTAFMPYASVNASILFLQKRANGNSMPGHETFMARAEKVGRKGNGDDDFVYDEAGVGRANSDLSEIVELFQSFQRTGKVPSSELAYGADIAANLADDPEGWRLDFRYHHPARNQSRKQLARAKGRLMLLSEVCGERNQTMIPSTEMPDQTILYTGLAHIEAASGIAHQVSTATNSLKSAVRRYEPGDVIFAKMRPNLRKVALMDFSEGGYVSPECIVLTPKEKNGKPIIDPLLLSVLLRSDLVYGQIMHLIAGIGRPRLAASDLRRVLIPSASSAAQEQWRAQYLSAMTAAETLKKKADELIADAARMEREAIANLAKEFV
jgi:excisionase family DNA binding protein